ncbi:MAG: hypothetical protein FWG29_11560, partial [Treponema sp.]|nr:hypothetical protein [Treponema sp.]
YNINSGKNSRKTCIKMEFLQVSCILLPCLGYENPTLVTCIYCFVLALCAKAGFVRSAGK